LHELHSRRAAATGTGTTFVGTTFSNGGYFEVSMAVPNPGGAINTMPSWPAAWFMDVKWFTGQVLRGAEPDIIEALPQTGSVAMLMAAHDWDFVNTINYNTGLTPSGPADVTIQHRYGFWWVPASKNNGTGVLRRYLDGVYQGQVLYSATSGATPAFAPSNPSNAEKTRPEQPPRRVPLPPITIKIPVAWCSVNQAASRVRLL